MKKPLLGLVGLAALSAMFVGIVNAEAYVSDLFSNGSPKVDNAYVQVLNNYDNTWGYSENDLIGGDFAAGDLRVTSPIVEDIGFDPATVYYLFISPYRVSQLKAGDPSVDLSKVIMKEVEITSDAENIQFTVGASALDPEQAYYGFISAIDIYEGFGIPSNEICFKMSTSTYNQGEGCDAFELVMDPTSNLPEDTKSEEEENHGAACVGMNMANITHTINGDTITLKWTAVDGDVVQIAVFDPEEAYWKSLGAVNMKDEKFAYKIQWNGEQNFMLTNGCGEVRYKADAAIKPAEPEKVVPQRVGPADNLLYIVIAAVILYGAYVLFFRKSEN